ncbi:MAG: CinA family protein, partial [Propionicimonas sp.]
GLIGAAVTSVPGASAAYLGGVVSYATPLKAVLAGVPDQILQLHGPVSAETAAAMATGVRALTDADWGLSATGVAGPDPQDGHAPGEVWIGVAGPRTGPLAERIDCVGDREAIRTAAVVAALNLLLRQLALNP